MIEAQVLGEDQDPSLDRYLHEWLAHARGRVRATTYSGYEYLIRVHAVPALGDVPLFALQRFAEHHALEGGSGQRAITERAKGISWWDVTGGRATRVARKDVLGGPIREYRWAA
jgi:hypothetical protein